MSITIEELPYLGLGASLSLSAKPDPVDLVKSKGGPAFVEYAGRVDADSVIDEISRIKQSGARVLFHPSYINFCGSWQNSEKWLKTTAEHIRQVESAWFAQDVAYCFNQGGSAYSTSLGYFIPPILNDGSLQLAIERVKEVQSLVPVPVAIEPPPMTWYAGSLKLCEFFAELVHATNAALLLDMGHLVSYEMASGMKIKDEIQLLPLERVIEVHVAGGRLKPNESGAIYIDAHECEILEQTWNMLEFMLPLLPQLRAVCYECEGVDKKPVLQTLEKLRNKVLLMSSSVKLINHMSAEP